MSKTVPMRQEDSIPGFERDYVQSVRSLIDPKHLLDGVQLKIFLDMCKHSGLDPIKKEIYAVPRYNSHTGTYELTTTTSIDAFRKIAEKTGNYAPGEETKFIYDDGKLIGATAYVKKRTEDGTWHMVSATAFIHEYRPSKNVGLWGKMPSVMIEKCAEARALRRAFPQMAKLYSEDEMEQAKEEDSPQEISSSPNPISEKQYEELDSLIGTDNVYRSQLLGYLQKTYNVSSIQEMPAFLYDKVKARAYKCWEARLEEVQEA